MKYTPPALSRTLPACGEGWGGVINVLHIDEMCCILWNSTSASVENIANALKSALELTTDTIADALSYGANISINTIADVLWNSALVADSRELADILWNKLKY